MSIIVFGNSRFCGHVDHFEYRGYHWHIEALSCCIMAVPLCVQQTQLVGKAPGKATIKVGLPEGADGGGGFRACFASCPFFLFGIPCCLGQFPGADPAQEARLKMMIDAGLGSRLAAQDAMAIAAKRGPIPVAAAVNNPLAAVDNGTGRYQAPKMITANRHSSMEDQLEQL